ncbi:PTS system transporter subunit IIA [Streptococcus pneumoniae]|nr:PTS system transporter subunit IIA [Streptococcus pneumoniae]
MEIKDILNVSLIQTDLQMQSKEEVFETLAQLLVETGYVSDRDQFIEGLYQREVVCCGEGGGSHSYKSQ